MLDYLKAKRGKSPAQVATADAAPILTAEDEDFFRRITTEVATPSATELPPTLPPRPHELPETGNPTGNDAQVVLRDHDHDSEPPTSYFPAEGSAHTSRGLDDVADSTSSDKKAKSKWSWMRRDSRDAKKKSTALGLKSAAEQGKASDTAMNEQRSELDVEAEKEEHEMANALEQLNLAAVDNRVFSISKETRELLAKFTLVLKDLMNGVPTAYNDLESLLTNSDDQLSKAYKHLPSWLQRLVQQLPSKMSKSVTPEVLAAAAEKHGVKSKYAEMAAHGAGKAGLKVKVPSLKDLVTKPGAVAGMLKAILNFLKLRFPAFLGLNVLYSLGLFVLLLIFWYCHKRGREVRLERERLTMEDELKTLDSNDESASDLSRSPSPLSEDEHHQQQKSSYPQHDKIKRGQKWRKTLRSKTLAAADSKIETTDKDTAWRKGEADRKAQGWAAAPSNAPLDSQESCVIC